MKEPFCKSSIHIARKAEKRKLYINNSFKGEVGTLGEPPNNLMSFVHINEQINMSIF